MCFIWRGTLGFAVLVNFSCGFSVILILNCVIAVFSKTCGMRYFWPFVQRYLIRKKLFYTVSDPFLVWVVSDRLGNSGNKLKIWNNSIPSRETVKTVTVCDSCQYHCDYVTLQFVCFNNQWVTDVLTLDNDRWPVIKPRALRHNRIWQRYKRWWSDRLCGFILWRRARGGGLEIIGRKTSLGVESTCKRNGWSSLERPFGKLRVL